MNTHQTEAKHTPAEWAISKLATPDYAPEFAIYSGNDRVAIVVGDKAQTNARLIAAAPELLEVAKLFLTALNASDSEHESFVDSGADVTGWMHEHAHVVKAALAKALNA
jgi:hypothetical protein